MKKLSIAVLGLTLFGCASSMKLIGQDPGIRLNRADTLHPVGENVEEMSCGFCEAQSYDSGGKCRATCIYKNQDGTCRSNDFLRMTDFVIDPISTADGQRWANDSLITLSGEAKQWRTLFVSSSEANREQALKRRICSVPTPGLSQTFYLTYPDPPENTPRDQWAQNRQALVGIQKIVLRYFFYYQAFEPTSDLSCYKGNLETGLGQIVQGGTYKSVMDYSQRIPGLKYMGSQIDYAANLKDGKGPNEFVVKVGDSEELQIAFGPLSAKSANFDNFQGHWSRSDIIGLARASRRSGRN
jgi:hypothetical protein